MLGAGIAALVSYIVLGLLTLIITRRYFKFDIDIMFVVKSIISSIIMSPFIWLIRPSSIISITISIFVGALIYFCALYLLKGFSRKEISFFQKFIKENFKNNFINTYINSR